MKLSRLRKLRIRVWSHSVWSAWIEMQTGALVIESVSGRTPYGVRGLK
ncbi:hypothetical protein ACX12E_02850 [Paenibacillus vandeheii]